MSMAAPIYQSFSPVGHLKDFTPKQEIAWNEEMQKTFRERIIGYSQLNDGPRTRFFDPTKISKKEDFATKTVDWTAFPKRVKDLFGEVAKWEKADSNRNYQDEYCEWSVQRNSSKQIERVTFTCEPYDYWEFMAKDNLGKVVELYQDFIDRNIQQKDLLKDGKYNPRNRWNNSTSGNLMHLICPPNSLFAEIELGAGATIVRRKEGQIVTEQHDLIECSDFGEVTRNSDPTIGDEVNKLARQGAAISFLNPVGLYLGKFEPKGWKTPDGTDPREFWKITRGTTEFPVRAVFEVPAVKGYKVSDITILGKPIRYGSQIADHLKVKLTAIAQDFDEKKVNIVDGCKIKPAAAPSLAGVDSLTATAEEDTSIKTYTRSVKTDLF